MNSSSASLLSLSSLLSSIAFLSSVLASGACSPRDVGDDTGGGASSCGALLPGDLVITEVMANPAGQDRGSEYFELYNAGSVAVDLAGAILAYRAPDSAGEKTHVVEDLVIEPGGYAALGSADPDALPDFIDYGFSGDLGSLRNAGAVLAVRCGDRAVDETEYPSAEGREGVASILDGAAPPDSLANDDLGNFCAAPAEFAPGLFGSPGAANEPCSPAPSVTCLDGGVERAAIAPVVGDLVISEFMAAPDGSDETNEWFEIVAVRDVDLNRLVLGRDDAPTSLPFDRPECARLRQGEYALFARSADPAVNGGLPAAAGTFSFALTGGRNLSIGIGEVVLDQVALVGIEAETSRALDPAKIDPAANDDPSHWHSCRVPYGDPTLANQGTPGAGNEACGAPDSCLDGGVLRPIARPSVGQILLTEVLANPAGTGPSVDPGHEWFEMTALADFDLNDLEIGKGGAVAQTVSSPDCLSVTRGARIVVAESKDPVENGDLPWVDLVKRFQLTNLDGSIFVGVGGVVLHELAYGTGTDGHSTQLDASGDLCLSPAAVPYNPGGDRGTPGAANPTCPAP